MDIYEVVWSWWADKYIIRPVNVLSSLRPAYVGTNEACQNWINRHA